MTCGMKLRSTCFLSWVVHDQHQSLILSSGSDVTEHRHFLTGPCNPQLTVGL